jgi:hypothetical protein
MRRSKSLMILVTAALAMLVACNFIVAGALDDFKPVDAQTFCSFELPTGAYAECGNCIQKECGAELSKSCNVTKATDRKAWFSNLKACAQTPDRAAGSSPCTQIETAADVAPSATGDEADRLRAFNCVRDKCLQPATVRAACRTCELKTGTPPVKLSSTTCGQCLERECKDEIVQYCGSRQTTGNDGGVTTVGTDTFLDCISVANPKVNACVDALRNAPAGRPDGGTTKQQDYELRTCGKRCVDSNECP